MQFIRKHIWHSKIKNVFNKKSITFYLNSGISVVSHTSFQYINSCITKPRKKSFDKLTLNIKDAKNDFLVECFPKMLTLPQQK